ncbi:helix-turn-helix domain-containing protein [Paracoccus pantotrophus]
MLRLQREGLGAADIARQLRIGRASVYRILSDRAAGGANSSAP